METAKIAEIINSAEKYSSEPPLSLRRQGAPSEAYPVDALGKTLADAAKAINAKIQAPESICAQSVLAAATLAVQAHADVELPTGQLRPLSCFFMTIAASGMRKSSCDMEALLPISAREETLREIYNIEKLAWENAKDAWDNERAKILKKDSANAKEKLNLLGARPQAPLVPMLTCGEPTYEGICRNLMDGQPSIGMFSDEGGQFIGGYGMNEENKLKTVAAFSGLWDGKPIKRVRAADGTTILPGKRVAVHLMAQPASANIMLSNRLLEDQGILSRFLFVAPENTIGTRFFRAVSPVHIEALNRYEQKISEIFNIPLPLKNNTMNELQPRTLHFTEEARTAWITFSDEVEHRMATGGLWEHIRGFANKLPEHAARLSGVLRLIDNIHANDIDLKHLECGIKLAEYYASEALRIQEQGYVNPDILLAEKLLQWLQNNWAHEFVSLPDIYQRGLNAMKDSKTARKTVSILEEHGWIIPVENGIVIDGKFRKEAWRIVSL
jgi:hypothetical protein